MTHLADFSQLLVINVDLVALLAPVLAWNCGVGSLVPQAPNILLALCPDHGGEIIADPLGHVSEVETAYLRVHSLLQLIPSLALPSGSAITSSPNQNHLTT